MTGTLINVAAILVGGGLGLLFGSRLPQRTHQTVVAGLGLFTLVIGFRMTGEMEQELVVLGGLLLGGLVGEWLGLEDALTRLGAWLEKHFANGQREAEAQTPAPEPGSDARRSGSRFIRGFLTASLLFAIGPIAILGSIQDGLSGDFNLLAIKSVLDGFASFAFASSLGVGVLFSSLVIFVYQGLISLLANQASAVISDQMMNEMTGVGGVLLIGVAISSLLELKSIRVGNFLPALLFAPLIVALLTAFGIL